MLSLCKGLCLFTLLLTAASQTLHTHDGTFIPDASLHVTRKNISIGGIWRYTTMINGSIPGPPLRFTENQVVWIRVYNDMADDNVTMVRSSDAFDYLAIFDRHEALAWHLTSGIPIFRWHSTGLAMADSSIPLLRLRTQLSYQQCRDLFLSLSCRISSEHSVRRIDH